jgi:hypothetical protein
MRWINYWLSGKATLAQLFMAAKRRVLEQTDDVANLPKARIVSATEELNQIADDIRDAQAAREASPSPSTVPSPEASPSHSTAPAPENRNDVHRQ